MTKAIRDVDECDYRGVAITRRRYKLGLAPLLVCLATIISPLPTAYGSDSAAETSSATEFDRGPHGGRLLTSSSLSLELSIFEQGTPPHFRVYPGWRGSPLSPDTIKLTVTLRRLGNQVDTISFKPTDSFLESTQIIEEPHSFDVEITAQYEGQRYAWQFASYEGRTTIAQRTADASGVATAVAGPHTIRHTLSVRGKVLPSEHRIAHIIPRFSGVVREGRKHIGDPVQRGEVLAVIESNQSLQPFEVRSQIAGTVINGHLIVGEFVPENQWVYVVADLSEVWADLSIPVSQREDVKAGQTVTLTPSAQGGASVTPVTATISYIAPYTDERTQTLVARAIVPNESRSLLPGMFLTGEVTIGESTAPVVVKRSALQRWRDDQAVFIKVGDTYEVRPVTLGESDKEWAAVTTGLPAGATYVTENSFLIKADILKAGASHDH